METYNVGRSVYAERLGARLVVDAPDEDVLHTHYHLLLGDLAWDDPIGVGLPPVLVGRVYPILIWLLQLLAEADRHNTVGQPHCLQPLKVFQQQLQLVRLHDVS